MLDKYGVKGPVHFLKQRKQWKLNSLAHLRSLDSFDVEFSATGQVLQKTDFQFDGERLVRRHSRYYAPDGSVGEQSIAEYDSNLRITRNYGLKADGQPLGDGEYRHEYDADGRESRVWSFNDLSDERIPNAVTVYEYSSDVRGNWIEQRKFFRFRGDSDWSYSVATREIVYYP